MATSQTFSSIIECVSNQALPVVPGCYVVTAITEDGETPFCDAICIADRSPVIPPIFPTPALDCVNYFTTNLGPTHGFLSWDAYPDALGYNVYSAPSSDPDNFSLWRENIPLGDPIEIACQRVVVTAITPQGETQKCAAVEYCSHCSEVDEWLTRIAANGGLIPPIDEQFAVCEFITELKLAGIWDTMVACIYFSPNGRATALTWLKPGPFSDTWDWHSGGAGASAGFPASAGQLAAQEFSVDGINTNGLFFDTAVRFDQLMNETGGMGVSVYGSKTGNSGANPNLLGCVVGAIDQSGVPTDSIFALHPWHRASNDPTFGRTTIWGYRFDNTLELPNGGEIPEQLTHKGCGFVSANMWSNRLAPDSSVAVNYGSSEFMLPIPSTWTLMNHTFGSPPNRPEPNGVVRFFKDDAQSNVFHGYCSFIAFHQPFSPGDVEKLFAPVQRLRQTLGGGYV